MFGMTKRTKVLTIRLTRRELIAFRKFAKYHGQLVSVAARSLLSSASRSIPNVRS